MRKILRLLAIVVVTVACPAAVAAQSAPEWASKIKPGKSLFVITTAGEQIDGKARAVGHDRIIIDVPSGSRTVFYDDVFRAERKDSAWSGLVYGGTMGLVIGVIDWKTTDCSGEFLKGLCESYASMAPMLFGIGGALIGWGIDAVVPGRRKVFELEPAARMSLVVGHNRAGVSVTW